MDSDRVMVRILMTKLNVYVQFCFSQMREQNSIQIVNLFNNMKKKISLQLSEFYVEILHKARIAFCFHATQI